MILQSYCTNCLQITEHKTSLDNGGDIVLTCQTEDCNRFWKVAARNLEGAMISESEMQVLIDLHYESNKNQVPAHTLYA